MEDLFKDSYIFANFLEPSKLYISRLRARSNKKTPSTLRKIIYSFDSKLSASHIRKQSCSKRVVNSYIPPVYKLKQPFSLKNSTFTSMKSKTVSLGTLNTLRVAKNSTSS